MDMDNHPIPQDVTHFQFKLIGEMTLKQFGYVAGGAILAYIFLSLPINILIRIPLAAFYAGSGAILAFIPIEGRPADTMIKNFVKALFSSTQYLYHKESADPTLSALLQGTISTQSLTGTSSTTPVVPPTQQAIQPRPVVLEQPTQIQRETVQFQAAPAAVTPQIAQKQATVITPAPQIIAPPQQEQPMQEEPKTNTDIPKKPILNQEEQELEKEADTLSSALQEAKTQEQQQQGTPGYEQAHQKALELEEQLQRTSAQKQRLEQELLTLRQHIATQPVYTPSTATLQQETEHVRKIPKSMEAGIGLLSVPDVPNLITGIVKDSRGNVLPNILIEVKDTEGNPVRAFKTNQLGQFASATPLLNGTYTIYFEDSANKHRFDAVAITATGEILLPIEITSIDQREELRKELFG